MTPADWSAVLSGLGDLATGIAAVTAVIITYVQARKELDRRREDRLHKEADDRAERMAEREERRATRRADVAAQLASSVQRFLVAMQVCASPMGSAFDPREPSSEPIEARRKAIVAALEPRWRAAEEQTRAFLEAWVLAKLYLPHGIDDLCDEVWEFRCSLLTNQMDWPRLLGEKDGRDDLIDAYDGAVGEAHIQNANSLIERTFALLRSHAQLGAKDEPRIPGPDWVAPRRPRARVPEVSDDESSPEADRPAAKRKRAARP